MAMVVVDDSCLKRVGLAAQVRLLGLRSLYIHHMNWVSSRNDLGHDDWWQHYTYCCGYYYYYYTLCHHCPPIPMVRLSIYCKPKHFPYYRQDAAKRQTAGIVFTHRPKIRFFAPQGRHVAPIQIKLCRTDGQLGPLGCAKFDVNRPRGVGMRPQNIKNFHFLVNSRPIGATPLTDFQNF